MPATSKTPAKPKTSKAPAARLTLQQVMAELEAAGTEQTRKTYRRHGARDPLFGVSFATLKLLMKRIVVDHELARELWATANFDARNLAVKILEPARLSFAELDQWARDTDVQMVTGYVAHVAVERPDVHDFAASWLAEPPGHVRAMGWKLVGAMAMCDVATADDWFAAHLITIEQAIHTVLNVERGPMNSALIAIGCRNDALRVVATAAAKRIGGVEIDHGDTACETVEAAPRIDKSWAHSTSKGFASPAAHERSRESMRRRC